MDDGSLRINLNDIHCWIATDKPSIDLLADSPRARIIASALGCVDSKEIPNTTSGQIEWVKKEISRVTEGEHDDVLYPDQNIENNE